MGGRVKGDGDGWRGEGRGGGRGGVWGLGELWRWRGGGGVRGGGGGFASKPASGSWFQGVGGLHDQTRNVHRRGPSKFAIYSLYL